MDQRRQPGERRLISFSPRQQQLSGAGFCLNARILRPFIPMTVFPPAFRLPDQRGNGHGDKATAAGGSGSRYGRLNR
jgi:hypothetical protein